VDHLWSPWRLDYVTGAKKQAGCVFCDAPRSSVPDPLIVFAGRLAYVILNKYPYSSGHVMVVPYRHEASLAALSAEEMQELGVLTQRCELALSEVYRPDGMNVGINLGAAAGAGIHQHLHVHVVPRWAGDVGFMTAVGDARVLPEEPAVSAERIRPVLARLEGGG
jgi:ATP adenylyltransferase